MKTCYVCDSAMQEFAVYCPMCGISQIVEPAKPGALVPVYNPPQIPDKVPKTKHTPVNLILTILFFMIFALSVFFSVAAWIMLESSSDTPPKHTAFDTVEF